MGPPLLLWAVFLEAGTDLINSQIKRYGPPKDLFLIILFSRLTSFAELQMVGSPVRILLGFVALKSGPRPKSLLQNVSDCYLLTYWMLHLFCLPLLLLSRHHLGWHLGNRFLYRPRCLQPLAPLPPLPSGSEEHPLGLTLPTSDFPTSAPVKNHQWGTN